MMTRVASRTMSRKKKWLIGTAVATLLGFVVLVTIGSILARRFEPYVREQAIEYLRKRFDSEVEMGQLRVHLGKTSPLRLLMTKGRGTLARVDGEGILLRHNGRRDVPPMFRVARFRFEVDLGTLFDSRKTIPKVLLEQMEINIPPKGERPNLNRDPSHTGASDSQLEVLIGEVKLRDAMLVILPKDKNKIPLAFNIQGLLLNRAIPRFPEITR
jgi:uncharacterized protein involved in outer membrane biogenesis